MMWGRIGEKGGGERGGGFIHRIGAEMKARNICSECGETVSSLRHYYKQGGCRKMTRKITNPARAALIAELDASIEQRLARYSKANPDLSMLNAEAWAEVQAVLDYAQRNRLTGALLPQRSRLKRLDDLEKFPALVVCKACSTFMEGGSIEQGMAFGYLLGICGGSATRWYEQLMRSGGFRLIAR